MSHVTLSSGYSWLIVSLANLDCLQHQAEEGGIGIVVVGKICDSSSFSVV